MVVVIMLGKVIKMNREDYFKYYIQGSDHYLIPKDVFIELFDEMGNWKEESQRQKEVIDKINNYIEKQTRMYGLSMPIELGTHLDNILGILKEVSE